MAYANFLQRINSATIDGLIFFIYLLLVVKGGEQDPALAVVSFFIATAVALFVTAILSFRYSGTPGNLLLNCQIVDADTGNPVNFKQAMLRSLGLFLTIASLGLGLLWVLFNKRKQALHDRIANTIVVYNGTIDMFDESQKSLRQLLSEVR